MIVLTAFVTGILVCGFRSAQICLLVAAAILITSGISMLLSTGTAGWLELAAVIGGYNMGVALVLCGALACEPRPNR